MKLMTKEIINKIPKLYANEGKDPKDVPIAVKFFNPTGAQSWYATEGEEVELEDGTKDWQFFGWCDLGFGPGCSELGYFMLSDLLSIRGRFGLGIERDMYFSGTLQEVMK